MFLVAVVAVVSGAHGTLAPANAGVTGEACVTGEVSMLAAWRGVPLPEPPVRILPLGVFDTLVCIGAVEIFSHNELM